MANYTLLSDSHVIIRSASSVHAIEWRATALSGTLEAERRGRDLMPDVAGRLEVAIRDLASGNRIYDLQLPRTVHARRYPTVIAELFALQAAASGFVAVGSVTFHGSSLPVESPVSVEVGDGTLRLSGTASFDLTDFDFKPPNVLGLQVYPEVEVDFSLNGQSDE